MTPAVHIDSAVQTNTTVREIGLVYLKRRPGDKDRAACRGNGAVCSLNSPAKLSRDAGLHTAGLKLKFDSELKSKEPFITSMSITSKTIVPAILLLTNLYRVTPKAVVMSIKGAVLYVSMLLVASASAQLEKPIDSLIPRESSTAYLDTSSGSSCHGSAVDAKSVRHLSTDYAGSAPWINDRVKSVAPEYPNAERVQRHQGEGVIRLELDLKTGLVTKATVIKSTGFTGLDNAAVTAFQRWTWKPGKWKEIDLPIRFDIGGAPLRALLREALAAEKAHDYNKAISICAGLIKRNPKLAPAYSLRSFAYRKKGDFDRSIDDLNEAIRLDPSKSNYLYRGMAYHERGQITESLADQDKAIADYGEVIRLDPNYVCAYYDRANAYNDKARLIQSTASLAEAIADSNTALRLKPGYAEARVSRGIAYVNKGEPDKAVADFNEAIRLNPKLGCAYSNLGACYHCQGEYDKSRAQFTKAIQLSPAPITYINRATTYDSAGDYDKAIDDLNSALRMVKNDVTWSARAYCERALAYSHKHDYGKAQSDFNKLTHMDAKDWYIYNAIGWFLATCPDAKFRDGPKAVQYAMQASKLAKPIESRAADTLAAAYAEAGDFDRAIKSEEDYLQFPNLSAERKAEAKSRLVLFQSHARYRDDKKSPPAADCGPFRAYN